MAHVTSNLIYTPIRPVPNPNTVGVFSEQKVLLLGQDYKSTDVPQIAVKRHEYASESN